MKDYYNVWMLTSAFELEPERNRQAIAATFARRNTTIPAMVPDGLSDAFAADPAKQRQWDAFASNLTGSVPEFQQVVHELKAQLMALVQRAS